MGVEFGKVVMIDDVGVGGMVQTYLYLMTTEELRTACLALALVDGLIIDWGLNSLSFSYAR